MKRVFIPFSNPFHSLALLHFSLPSFHVRFGVWDSRTAGYRNPLILALLSRPALKAPARTLEVSHCRRDNVPIPSGRHPDISLTRSFRKSSLECVMERLEKLCLLWGSRVGHRLNFINYDSTYRFWFFWI